MRGTAFHCPFKPAISGFSEADSTACSETEPGASAAILVAKVAVGGFSSQLPRNGEDLLETRAQVD